MTRIVNNVRGSIRIEITGPFPERFVNACAQNGILFWGMEKIDELTICTCMFPAGYKRALKMAGTMGCDVKMISEKGAPFFLKKFKKRYALIAGLSAFIIVVVFINQFIWEFEVEGNKTVSSTVILQQLEDMGIKLGIRSDSIDIASIRNEMLLQNENLVWITVNAKGGRANVIIRERKPKPVIIPKDQPCNIVASKAGLISEINTLEGTSQVQVGQTVSKGDILVSGVIDSAIVGMRYVHSLAMVKARTWKDITAIMPTDAKGKHYTGRVKTRNALVIAGKRINLYKEASAPYEFYDKITKSSVLRVPPGVTFPVTLITEEYVEYSVTEYAIDEAVAEGLLRSSLENRLYDSVQKGEVNDMNILADKRQGAFVARLTAECLEEITQIVPIPK